METQGIEKIVKLETQKCVNEELKKAEVRIGSMQASASHLIHDIEQIKKEINKIESLDYLHVVASNIIREFNSQIERKREILEQSKEEIERLNPYLQGIETLLKILNENDVPKECYGDVVSRYIESAGYVHWKEIGDGTKWGVFRDNDKVR